jgi:hypothetical protein
VMIQTPNVTKCIATNVIPPVKPVIASAILSCQDAVCCSRILLCFHARMFRSRTGETPGGDGGWEPRIDQTPLPNRPDEDEPQVAEDVPRSSFQVFWLANN